MADPLFSVVICNYNCGRYCPDALESVFKQNLPSDSYEIIAVDDGSDDGSGDVLKRYVPRIKAVLEPHGGQASALNAALPLCRGEWVSFLESDDIWLPRKLEAVLEAFTREPRAAAVSHPMRQADAALNPLPTAFPLRDETWTLQDFLKGGTAITGLSALCVRRKILAEFFPLPTDLTTCVDEYLHPLLLDRGLMAQLREPLGLRRVHGANFYAGLRSSAEKLGAYLSLRRTLDDYLRRFLDARHAVLDPRFANARRRRDLEDLFFLRRWKKEWRASARTAAEIVRSCGLRPYALFKAASLLCAMASPSLYLTLHRRYENSSRLAALRARTLPE